MSIINKVATTGLGKVAKMASQLFGRKVKSAATGVGDVVRKAALAGSKFEADVSGDIGKKVRNVSASALNGMRRSSVVNKPVDYVADGSMDKAMNIWKNQGLGRIGNEPVSKYMEKPVSKYMEGDFAKDTVGQKAPRYSQRQVSAGRKVIASTAAGFAASEYYKAKKDSK